MKKVICLLALLLIAAYGSYKAVDNFYETHKNDNQVTAICVPQFMFSLISEIFHEMKPIVSNIKALGHNFLTRKGHKPAF